MPSQSYVLITEENLTYNSWYGGCQFEQGVNTSTSNSMTDLIDEIPCGLYLPAKVLSDPTDPETGVQDPPHSIEMCLRH